MAVGASDKMMTTAELREIVKLKLRTIEADWTDEPLKNDILKAIDEFEAGLKRALKIIDECDDKETYLDDGLCKECPLYKIGEAGIFCSYWVLKRIIEGAS